MDMIKWIQDWYKSNCDGDWEHMFQVKIETVDNPGWSVSIDILDTPLEDKDFKEKRSYISDENWIICTVRNDKFEGRGDPDKLDEILKIFKEWAES